MGHPTGTSGALFYDLIVGALRDQYLGRLALQTYLTDCREEESEVCCSFLRVEKAISEETFRMRSTDDRLEIYIRYHVSKPTIPTYLLS